MDEWKSFSGLSNIALDPTNLRDHKPQINEQRIDREMWVMLDKWILNCKMSYFLDIFWLLTSWSHRRQRLKYRMEQEQTTTGLWRENTTCNIRLPAVASFFILMGKKHLLWKGSIFMKCISSEFTTYRPPVWPLMSDGDHVEQAVCLYLMGMKLKMLGIPGQ